MRLTLTVLLVSLPLYVMVSIFTARALATLTVV